MSIELRVSGKNCDTAAQELAAQFTLRFGVKPHIHPQAAPMAGDGQKVDVTHVTLLASIALVGFELYKHFIREPAKAKRERLVEHWRQLVLWAAMKHPDTLVHIVIGAHARPLHIADPYELHEMTAKAMKAHECVVVEMESVPAE